MSPQAPSIKLFRATAGRSVASGPVSSMRRVSCAGRRSGRTPQPERARRPGRDVRIVALAMTIWCGVHLDRVPQGCGVLIRRRPIAAVAGWH